MFIQQLTDNNFSKEIQQTGICTLYFSYIYQTGFFKQFSFFATSNWLYQTGFFKLTFFKLAFSYRLFQTGFFKLAFSNWLYQTDFFQAGFSYRLAFSNRRLQNGFFKTFRAVLVSRARSQKSEKFAWILWPT